MDTILTPSNRLFTIWLQAIPWFWFLIGWTFVPDLDCFPVCFTEIYLLFCCANGTFWFLKQFCSALARMLNSSFTLTNKCRIAPIRDRLFVCLQHNLRPEEELICKLHQTVDVPNIDRGIVFTTLAIIKYPFIIQICEASLKKKKMKPQKNVLISCNGISFFQHR